MAVAVTDGPSLLASVSSLADDLRQETTCVQKYRELIAEAEKVHSKGTGKYESRVKSIRELKRILQQCKKSGKATPEELEGITSRLHECELAIKEIEDARPSTGSLFVRLFLGQVNVKALFARDRTLLRDEYEKFKSRTNLGFIVFPFIWLITYIHLRHHWRYTHWIHILTHVWLLYYYVSLSLRVNILKVNGSNIRPWWIYHHYLSAFMSILVLTWPPDSVSWDTFTPTFTAFFWYQGIVQFVQAWYQKRRHYALTAMGKVKAMDVANTETLTEFHAGLVIIVVLVVIAQAWQVWIGYALLQTLAFELDVSQPWYDFREEVQSGLLGVGFCVLGCSNFVTTMQTLVDKSRAGTRPPVRSRSGSVDAPGTPTPPGRPGANAASPVPGMPSLRPIMKSTSTSGLSIGTPGQSLVVSHMNASAPGPVRAGSGAEGNTITSPIFTGDATVITGLGSGLRSRMSASERDSSSPATLALSASLREAVGSASRGAAVGNCLNEAAGAGTIGSMIVPVAVRRVGVAQGDTRAPAIPTPVRDESLKAE